MANFSVERDRGTDIVTCLVTGFLADEGAEALLAQLTHQMRISRQNVRPFRLLFDNRMGSVFSAKAAQTAAQLKGSPDSRDRTAVIVSDSLHKLQAKRNASEKTQIFSTEPEARAWLTSSEA